VITQVRTTATHDVKKNQLGGEIDRKRNRQCKQVDQQDVPNQLPAACDRWHGQLLNQMT
jgi:hypothetical protein